MMLHLIMMVEHFEGIRCNQRILISDFTEKSSHDYSKTPTEVVMRIDKETSL